MGSKSWSRIIVDELGRQGAKQTLILVLAAMLLVGMLTPLVGAPSFTDTLDADFAQGEHENTENVDNNVRLAGENIQGRFTSHVFDAGQVVENWDNIVWSVTTPSLTKQENDNVGDEPDPLIDENSRIGTVVPGSSLADTRDNDNVYENIQENNLGTPITSYTYVATIENVKGTYENFDNQKQVDGGYSTLRENGVLKPVTFTLFSETFPVDAASWTGTGQDETWNVITISEAADISISSGTATGTAVSGDPVLRMEDCDDAWGTGDIVWAAVDLSGYTNVVITYYWQLDAVDATEGFRSAFSNDATGGLDADGTWQLMYERLDAPEDVWTQDTYNLPDDNAVANFKFRFNAYGTGPGEESFIDDVKITGDQVSTVYGMVIYENIDNITLGDNHYLEIYYKLQGTNDNFRVQVENSTGDWNYRGENLTENVWTLWSYNLNNSTELVGTGDDVHIRFIDVDNEKTTQENIDIDYVRVRTVTAVYDYGLRWEHSIENVATDYDNYWVRVRGYTSGSVAENVGVYIWENQSGAWGWGFLDNLTDSVKTITKYIPGDNIDNYLVSDNISIKYEDWDNTDDDQTTLHVDLCIVEENGLFETGVKLQVRVSADNVIWTDNLGPDGTPNSYFISQNGQNVVSLENIPDNWYFQYIAYFSSEDTQLTGADGPLLHDVTINYTLPPQWDLIETWTGTVQAPAAWQTIETWIGTVSAPAQWQLIESWTGMVEAPAEWQVIETWAGTVQAPVAWQIVETWTGTVSAPAEWQVVETWTGTVQAPTVWQLIETWTGTINAPAEWGIVETWTGTVQAPVQWQVIETWTGTVNAPAVWQVIESWTGMIQAPAAWQFIETWTGTVTAPAPPGKPVLVSPENVTQTDNTPTFKWTAGFYADNHRLLVDNDLNFSTPNENRIIQMPENTYIIPPENSLPDDNYYWMVVAINELGENESDNWTFEVIAALLPGKPVLFAPENETQTSNKTPTFEWVVGSNADNHRIEVDNEPNFSAPLVDNVVLGPLDDTWTAPGYAEGTYYWRVWAINEAGEDVSENTWVIEIIPLAWYPIETWTGTVQAPAQWQLIESWTGTVSAPAEWQMIETWTGTVSAPVQWQVVETWTGTVSAPAVWQLIETWTRTVSAPVQWNLIESWTGTVSAPVQWSLIETWVGTVSAPTQWSLIETWTGTVSAPVVWQLVGTWTGTVEAPAAWQLVETWTGTIKAPVVWQLIETWTGTVEAPLVWRLIETWTSTVEAPAAWQLIETWIGEVIVPGFTISVNPTSGSVKQGDWTTATITITSIHNYSLTVSLEASVQPSDIAITFTPPSGTPTFESTMTILVGSNAQAGDYPITIIGTGADNKVRTCTYVLTITAVTPPPPPPPPPPPSDTTPPPIPLLISPADGAKMDDDTPTFTWTTVSDPSGVTYSLQVDNDADFSSPEINVTSLIRNAYTPTIALADGDYSWRVRAVDGANNFSDWFTVWSFKIETAVPPPPPPPPVVPPTPTPSLMPIFYALLATFAALGGGYVTYLRWFRPIPPAISLKWLRRVAMRGRRKVKLVEARTTDITTSLERLRDATSVEKISVPIPPLLEGFKRAVVWKPKPAKARITKAGRADVKRFKRLWCVTEFNYRVKRLQQSKNGEAL